MAGDYRVIAYDETFDRSRTTPYTQLQQGPDQSSQPEVLTYQGAADLLRVSVRTLERLVARKRVPHRRLGNKVRFSRPALLRWMDPEAPDSTQRRLRYT